VSVKPAAPSRRGPQVPLPSRRLCRERLAPAVGRMPIPPLAGQDASGTGWNTSRNGPVKPGLAAPRSVAYQYVRQRADGMLELHKELAAVKTEQEKTVLRRHIEATEIHFPA